MAQLKTGKSQEFDSIVIGGGLSGLIVAHQLEGTGRRVAIVEALDMLGGNCRPYQSAIGPVDNGLKFFPSTPVARESLEWMETVLGHSLDIEEVDAPPVTYDNGKFQPFVGFGDTTLEAPSEFAYFTSPKHLITSSTPKDWVKTLAETFTGQVFLQSHVTRFQYDDGFLIELLVNGTKKLSAREYIFCAPPAKLASLLPDNATTSRQKHRLVKGKFFTAIYLDFIHGHEVTNSLALHMLKGANEEPLVGVFQPSVKLESGDVAQYSQWCTYMRADLDNNIEESATALKKIKRQLKRAYETSLDNMISERIVVTPSSHGEIDSLLAADQRWPKIDNLWIASNFFNSNRDMIGTLDQCRRVLKSFSEQPLETDLEDTLTTGPNLTV